MPGRKSWRTSRLQLETRKQMSTDAAGRSQQARSLKAYRLLRGLRRKATGAAEFVEMPESRLLLSEAEEVPAPVSPRAQRQGVCFRLSPASANHLIRSYRRRPP